VSENSCNSSNTCHREIDNEEKIKLKGELSIKKLMLLLTPDMWRKKCPIFTLPSRGVQYCDECECLSVCVSVCPWRYPRNHISKLHQIFYACYLWPRLGPSVAVVRYVMHLQSYDLMPLYKCVYYELVLLLLLLLLSFFWMWQSHTIGLNGGMTSTAALLQCCASANTPAAWYCLHILSYNCRHQD